MGDHLQRVAGFAVLVMLSSFVFSLFAGPAVAGDPRSPNDAPLAKTQDGSVLLFEPAFVPTVTLPLPTTTLPKSPITSPITAPPITTSTTLTIVTSTTLPPITLPTVTTTLPRVTTTSVTTSTTTKPTPPSAPPTTATTTVLVIITPTTTTTVASSQETASPPVTESKQETSSPAGDRDPDPGSEPATNPPTQTDLSPDTTPFTEPADSLVQAPSNASLALDRLVTAPLRSLEAEAMESIGDQLSFRIPSPAVAVFTWPMAMLEMLVEALQSAGRAMLVPFSLAGAIGWWLGRGETWPWEESEG